MSTINNLIEERERPIVPNHLATIEVQQLHALIRIEETLTSILEGLRHFAKQQSSEERTVDAPAPKVRRK